MQYCKKIQDTDHPLHLVSNKNVKLRVNMASSSLSRRIQFHFEILQFLLCNGECGCLPKFLITDYSWKVLCVWFLFLKIYSSLSNIDCSELWRIACTIITITFVLHLFSIKIIRWIPGMCTLTWQKDCLVDFLMKNCVYLYRYQLFLKILSE